MRKIQKRVLIIKLGALGDVVRTTAILNVLDGHVTWITKPNANPLLCGIKKISFLTDNPEDLRNKHFDVVYSLDDDIEGCSILKLITFDRLYGFYEDSGKVLPMPEAKEWWAMSLNGPENRNERKQANRESFQYFLFKNIGKVFNGEKYMLGFAPKKVEEKVIGLETEAGGRWPMKKWPYYSELKKRLTVSGFDVRVFEFKEDIRDYVEDINSCRVVVSGDTLALHLALALNKKVVSLFGPTSPYEIELYGQGKKLYSDRGCIACYQKINCEKKPNCMECITVDTVYNAAKELLNE